MTMQKQEGTLYFKQCLVCLLNMTGLKWKGGKQGQYWATAFTLKAKCGICVCMPVCLCVCVCVPVRMHVHAHTHIHTYIYYCRTGKIYVPQMCTQTSQCSLRTHSHQCPHWCPSMEPLHPLEQFEDQFCPGRSSVRTPHLPPGGLLQPPALVLRDRAPSDRAVGTRSRQRQAGSEFALPLRSWGSFGPLDAPNTYWEPITGQTQLWTCFFNN